MPYQPQRWASRVSRYCGKKYSEFREFWKKANLTQANSDNMLDSLFSKTSPPSYSRLKTSSSQESLQTLPTPTSTSPSSPSLTPRIASRIVQLCKLVIFPLIFTSLGIIIGLTLSRHGSSISTAVNLNIHPNLFTYNPLFGSKPSNESDEAWEELFPKRGGFFNHPVIAPKRSAYAVFHQLHCLVC